MATLKYTGNRPHFTVITIQFIVKYLFGRRAPGLSGRVEAGGWAARRGGTGGWQRGRPRGPAMPAGNARVRSQGESSCQMARPRARQTHFPPDPALRPALLEGQGPATTQHLAQTQPRTPTGARSRISPRSLTRSSPSSGLTEREGKADMASGGDEGEGGKSRALTFTSLTMNRACVPAARRLCHPGSRRSEPQFRAPQTRDGAHLTPAPPALSHGSIHRQILTGFTERPPADPEPQRGQNGEIPPRNALFSAP